MRPARSLASWVLGILAAQPLGGFMHKVHKTAYAVGCEFVASRVLATVCGDIQVSAKISRLCMHRSARNGARQDLDGGCTGPSANSRWPLAGRSRLPDGTSLGVATSRRRSGSAGPAEPTRALFKGLGAPGIDPSQEVLVSGCQRYSRFIRGSALHRHSQPRTTGGITRRLMGRCY